MLNYQRVVELHISSYQPIGVQEQQPVNYDW